jgi:glycerophosphoryl diester phosphodiesterase
MKVIGHRGAAGLALENTLPSIELARLLGVDAIEFDVRMTKDHHLVLCHDATLDRVSDSSARIRDLSLRQLKKVKLRDGESRVPSLKEALSAVDGTPVIIELKENGCEQELLKVIAKFPSLDITIASFKLEVLSLLREMRPDLKLYANEHTRPTEIIHIAKRLKLDGVGLNFWLLNPLTYHLAKKETLNIFVYTVNNRFLGKFIGWLYPRIAICSDYPEQFLKQPYPIVRTIAKVRDGNNSHKHKRSYRKSKGYESKIRKNSL